MSALDTLLTRDEAARRLRISPRTLDKALKCGEITYHRIGRLVRIPSECIDSFLARTYVSPDPGKKEG